MEEKKGKMVSHELEEVKRIIGGKADLYEAAVRNGWYLTKMKSSIITEDYITGVITGKFYCPRFEENRLVPCPRSPDKSILIRDIQRLMASEKKHSGIDDKHVPDK
jgi:hypothetical protein